MKLLVIGSGGREHALAWKLAQSPRVQKVYVAPGNGGTAAEPDAENVPLAAIAELAAFARKESIHLTVVGPEAPLAAGVVDAFMIGMAALLTTGWGVFLLFVFPGDGFARSVLILSFMLLTALVAGHSTAKLLESLQDNGQIALTVEEFPSHETYQFKGRYLRHRAVHDDDLRAAGRIRDRFLTAVRHLYTDAPEALLMNYVQTPVIAVGMNTSTPRSSASIICSAAQPPETCSFPAVAASTAVYFGPAGATSTFRQRKVGIVSKASAMNSTGKP